jgi:hypothetical protein
MFVVVLNQTNLVQDGQNNKLIYKFPNSVLFKDHYIGVSSISMYYSWYNISTQLNNNKFAITWPGQTTVSVTIPDGVYEVKDLNNLIQFTCIANGYYWTIAGTNYYPFELLVNPTRYAVQLNTYLLPASLPTGATVPGNFPGWPANPQNATFTVLANLTTLLGFSSSFATAVNNNNSYTPPSGQSLIAKDAAGTLSYLSDIPPNVQPNGSIFLSISNINNPYSSPSSIIYAINPGVSVGELISERHPNYTWAKLISGTYSELRLSFLGSDKSPIQIKDPNMTIILTIKSKDENYNAS